jgi:PAS domain S-box-containing protein
VNAKRGIGLTGWVACLVMGAVVPLLLLATVTFREISKTSFAFTEKEQADTTRAMALAVDGEVRSWRTGVLALAASQSLRHDRLAEFYEEARQVASQHEGWVVLYDATGQQYINTLRPFGSQLPMTGAPEMIEEVVREGKLITDMYFGAVAQRFVIANSLPIFRDGHFVYCLSLILGPESLNRLLQKQQVPPTWVAAINDDEGRVVARFPDVEARMGKPTAAWYAAAIRATESGIMRGPRVDGSPARFAFQRLHEVPWVMGLSVPISELLSAAPIWRFILVGLVLGLAAVGMAVFAGHRITAPVARLAAAGGPLVRGGDVNLGAPSGIRQVRELQQAVVEASESIRARYREREQAEESLRRANDALQAANAALQADIQQRRRAEAALRVSEERLAAIIDTAMDAIITLDEQQRVVLFNATAERTFGYPASAVIGGPLNRLLPERFHQIHASHIQTFGTTGDTARSMGCLGRLYGRRAGGEEFPFEATISQASARGQKLYTVILRDITQREKAEEVARLYAKTKELERLRMEFFANISHELRTPLALILGPVWKILEAGGLADEERRDLEVVERNARLLLRHVNDLLDLAKVDAGRMTAEYAEVDLARLGKIVASNFESLAAERALTYVLDLPDSLPAEVDSAQIERVLLNLLSNAFKFTPTGGCVRFAIQREGERAILEVEDTGPGIPPHLREAIFERFRQVEGGSDRRFGGTGLGLSIAKEFVSLHGGRIIVLDPPSGKGSVFRVELPLRAPNGTEVTPTSGEPPAVSEPQVVDELGLRQAPRHHSGKAAPGSAVVLVVEDNPDMNAFLARTLSQAYHVVSAFNGQEGLQKALEIHPDLILCDVMMPRMSGDHLVRELRRRREVDDVPIVLLTAKVDDGLRVALLKEGAQDYLHKPVDVEHLLAKVERLIEDRRRASR